MGLEIKVVPHELRCVPDFVTPNQFGYDDKHDIAPVDQFGYINLAEAHKNGFVPGNVELSEDHYNDIDEPGSILGRPRDVFDARHLAHSIEHYAVPSNNPSGE